MTFLKILSVSSAALMLAACAATPMGPTILAMPQQGKPFERFAEEQAYCKSYASAQIQGQAERANTTGLLEGLGGTALGAGFGAAVGGGKGAAVGAATGAALGTAVGAHTSSRDQKSIQQQYDDAYVQCMVAKGNSVQHASPPPQTTVIYQQPAPTVVYTQPAPPPTVIYTQPAPQRPPY